MLRIRNLDSGYGSLTVLRRVSIHVKPGEIVSIVGANGAGKTTLLMTILGLIRARSGEILFEGQEIAAAPTDRIVALGCSLVPEGRQVFADMTVRENLLLGGYVQRRRAGRHDLLSDLDRVCEIFPVLAERRRQLAGTLSGGEQQMLAMGRALMARPRMLMLDEPSMGLAPLVVRDIFGIIVRIAASGSTVLLVEQNARSAFKVAHRGYVLETGTVVLQGSSEELLANRDVQRAYLGKDASEETERRTP